MSDGAKPVILRSAPGIKRDGTRFDGDNYTDGRWVRFQRGLPRKIGGYRRVTNYVPEISRGFNAYTQNSLQYCHTGSANKLYRFTVDSLYSASIMSDRTPSMFPTDPQNRWMFANAYSPSATANQIIAHVAPNGSCVCNDVGGDIYAGDLTDTAALTAVTMPMGIRASGGIVTLGPYLMYYGSSGIVGWSIPGEPTDLTGSGSGQARPWGQKIVKGIPLRGGSAASPSGLLIAYDAVLRASFVGGAPVFAFDTIATETSILSAESVIDYDGVIYWPGVDRFLMFNGVVREVPNTMNVNFFFDNLSIANRTKVYSFKVTRYGEIWWCFPFGNATECNHAIIYNVRENTWYDTPLPDTLRSAGQFNNAFAKPLLMDTTLTTNGYSLWLHESGVDQIAGQSIEAVQSYFETADLSFVAQGEDGYVRIPRIEPDFVQRGDMQLQVRGRANARATINVGEVKTFPATAQTVFEQTVTTKNQYRELWLRFESNTVGGDYQMGQVIAHLAPGDMTVVS